MCSSQAELNQSYDPVDLCILGERRRRPKAECQHEDRRTHDRRLAEEDHQALEADAERVRARVAECGQREDRQRPRRVLELEVAVRDPSVFDRRSVAFVDRRVDDRVVREEASVQRAPGDQEEDDRIMAKIEAEGIKPTFEAQ